MAGLKVNLTVTEGSEKGKSFSFYEPDNFRLGRGEKLPNSPPNVGGVAEGRGGK